MIGARADGHEGADHGRGRLPRERRELEDGAPRPEAPRHARAGRGRGRRGARLLGGRAGRVAEDARAAGLVPQARQHPRQAAEAPPAPREGGLHEVMYAETRAQAARRSRRSPRNSRPSTRRRSDASIKDGEACSPSSTFPPSTGSICARATSSSRPFATVRLRQRVTKGAGSRTKALTDGLQALDLAQARWRKLDGAHLLPLVHAAVQFIDGAQTECLTDPENRKEAA